MRTHFSLLAFFLAGSVLAAPKPETTDAALVEAGRRIYEQGILPNGAPLQGVREGGTVATGRDAACVLCHQRSGMGLAEGANLVPPVTATALFGKLKLATYGRAPRRAPGMEFKDWPFKTRPPYTDGTLAQAMRTGVSPTGHRFQYMMPRYELGDQDMKALIAYLRALSAKPSPGGSTAEAHFATVVAPGVDPARRDAFLGVLKACFREKLPEENKARGAPGWQLHVWELKGSPSTWEAQLQRKYERRPVFAMVSGLGSDEWAPVERFCEANSVPCLFPNVEVPGSPEGGRYSLYFYRGALLEADVIAGQLKENREKLGLRRVVVVSRADGASARAATQLQERLKASELPVEHRVLGGSGQVDAIRATAGIDGTDALVLLLPEADLATLAKLVPTPPAPGMMLMSGLLGGLENTPLSAAWREHLLMTYPFDPPVRWNRRMDFNLRTWLAENKLARDDERMQGNTLAACNLLFEGMLRLRGQYLRDYLVEWTENYPTQMGNAPAPQAFPRFSLGPGQRFSSKGAYVARFARPDFQRLEQAEDWIVP